MQCSSCGTQLPVGGVYCPTCGTVTPYRISESGISPDDLTAASSTRAAPLQAPPIDYGSPSYGVLLPNPYELPNPYAVPPQTPPSRRRLSARLTALLVGVVVLILVGSAVIYYATVFQPNQLHIQASAAAHVQSTATMHAQQVTATAAANTPQGIYDRITSGTPVFNDPLSQNDNANNWSQGADTRVSGGCFFTGAAYHVSLQKKNDTEGCVAQSTNFSNFAYQVEMTLNKGDFGGIFFRADLAKSGEYDILFSQDGTYYFILSLDATGTHDSTLQSGTAPNFKTGLNQVNLIAVVASGGNLYLYVNKQYVTSVTDNTFGSGPIGVRASENSLPTEVWFRNAQVWNM